MKYSMTSEEIKQDGLTAKSKRLDDIITETINTAPDDLPILDLAREGIFPIEEEPELEEVLVRTTAEWADVVATDVVEDMCLWCQCSTCRCP